MSNLTGCYIKQREGDTATLFTINLDGSLTVDLRGYAIVPKEEYFALKERKWWQVWR